MKVVNGKRVSYASDKEFYQRQIRASKPHDRDRLVKTRISEALRFLMLGGTLEHSSPQASRPDPGFSENVAFLDVGCRDGWSLAYLNRGLRSKGTFGIFSPPKHFRNVTGIELSGETVEYAKTRKRNVIQADIRSCVLNDAFDIIFSRHCLEHLDTPLWAVKNIARMLKPGGTFLAIVPREDIDLNPDKSLHSYQFRGDNDLADLIMAAGLHVTVSFRRNQYWISKRKYWYKLLPKRRLIEPELWVLATKN